MIILNTCNAGFFKLFFEEDPGTTVFSDPTLVPSEGLPLGQVRMNTICKAFEDLSVLIQQSPQSNSMALPPYNPANPIVRIHIQSVSSLAPMVLAAASPIFAGPAGVPPPVYYGEVWNTINIGFDSYGHYMAAGLIPTGSNPYHGYMVFNNSFSGDPLTSGSFGGYYQVTIHEAMHLLGFITKTNPSISSNDFFTKWDLNLHLQSSTSTSFISSLTNIDISGCIGYYQSNNALLTSNCSLVEKGDVGFQPVMTPSTFDATESICHLDGVCPPTGMFNCSHNSITNFNYPSTGEADIFCSLGYRLRDNGSGLATYGTNSSLPMNYKNDFLLCSSARVIGRPNTMTTTAGVMGSTAVLGNDINANDIFCVEIVLGAGTFTMSGTGLSTQINFTPVLSSCPAGSNGLAILRYMPVYIDPVSFTITNGNYTYVFVKILPPPIGTDIYPDCPTGVCGPNLVANGNFSEFPSTIPGANPNPSVATGLGFDPNLDSESEYSICNFGSGFFTNANGFNVDDHSVGLDNLMFVATQAKCRLVSGECFEYVWKQSGIAVSPGTDYIFSFWVRNINKCQIPGYSGFPCGEPILGLRINGAAVGSPYFIYSYPDNDDYPDDWTRICYQWTAPPTVTSADLVIASYDNALTNIIRSFAIDDIDFREIAPTPPTAVISPASSISFCDPAYSPTLYANPGPPIPGYTYLWSNGATGNTISDPAGLPSGSYYFQVTDATGCVNFSDVVVIEFSNDCCVSNYLEINSTTYASSLPDPTGFFNQVVVIAADLIIDVPGFTIQNTTITFKNPSDTYLSGPKILLKDYSQLFIDNSHLYSCQNMWRGIVTDPTGNTFLKIFNGSIIEDAWVGADICNWNTYLFDWVYFNRNYKGIKFSTLHYAPVPGTIVNSKFWCVDNWFNQATGAIANSVPLSGLNYASLCGIQVYETDEVIIGEMGQGNEFGQGLRNGILMQYSGIYLNDNQIGYEITGFFLDNSGDPLSGINWKGLWTWGQWNPAWAWPMGFVKAVGGSIFDFECRKTAAVYFDDCQMNGGKLIGDYVGLLPSSPQTSSVTITNCEFFSDIQLIDNPIGIINVSHNNLSLSSQEGELFIDELPGSGAQVTVFDNYLEHLSVTGVKGALIDHNTIIYPTTTISSYSNGIVLYNVENSKIVYNDISIIPAVSYGDGIGINSNIGSHSNYYTCNEITGSLNCCGGCLDCKKVGLYIKGPHVPDNKVAMNKFIDCTEGGILFEDNGIIGTQGDVGTPSDNEWLGPYSPTDPHIKNIATAHVFFDGTIFLPYIMYYKTILSSYIPQFQVDVFSTDPLLLLDTPPTTTLTNCYSVPYMPMLPGSGDEETAESMARDGLSFIGDFAEECKWRSNHNLYNYLLNYPAMVAGNSFLGDFMTDNALSPAAKIEEAAIFARQNMDSSDFSYSSALSIIAEINDSNNQEKALKSVMTLSYQRFNNPGFPDSVQKDDLVYYATRCPDEYGIGVFAARTLLKATGDTNFYYHTCENPPLFRLAPEGQKKYPAITISDDNLKISVSPNPFSEEVTVISSENILGTLEVYNLLGECLFVKKVSGLENKVNTQPLSSGIYYYKIQIQGNMETFTGKIVKIK